MCPSLYRLLFIVFSPERRNATSYSSPLMATASTSEAAGTGLYSAAGITRMSINLMPIEVLSKAFAHLGDDFASRWLELILDVQGVAEYRHVGTTDLGDECAAKLRDIMRRESPCLYVTRVCRRWYNVAVSTPQLWTCPPIFHAEATATFISRVDDSTVEWPLVVSQLHESTLADPDRQRALLPVLIPKTCGLLWLHNVDIQETRDEVGNPGHPLSLVEVERALSLRTDALQELYVVNRGTSRLSNPLPVQLSERVPPRLHTLYIRGRRIRADHPLFTANLQSLTLVAVTSVWHNVDEMLDTLSELPELEKLVLRATALGSIVETEPTNSSTLASERRVSLPRLQFLTLDDRMRSLTAILYALVVPQPAFRDVMIKIFDAQSVAAFSRALDAHYQRDGPQPGFKGFEHVYLEVEGDPERTIIRASLLHTGPHLALPDVARRADLLNKRAHLTLRTFDHSHEFIAALEILSGTPVVCLDGLAHRAISHMHNIRWLSLDPFYAARFVADAAEGRLDNILTSSLRVLQLEGTVFAMDHESSDTKVDPEPIDMRLLLPWLSTLVSKGTFRLLCLFDCHIRHITQIASLKAVIGEERLYWDGVLVDGEGTSTADVEE
ncbi:hypothetical protein PENSPDRAFT_381518 [Peniophora sp. CONT]|nr:hypothetical protein PENSPDRAFT_381518 [Peniophora sp. CONT]